jgi:dephospho-CoA kinase
MIKVGLTGNIGSGKSVVAAIFASLGAPVFHADSEARKLFDDEKIKEQVRAVFGPDAFTPSAEVNRKVLAEIVFDDIKLLSQLNSIIHPAVRSAYHQWCRLHAEMPYTLYEAAILFESGHYQGMDKIICVTAPEALRIRRVMDRDGITAGEVSKRIANQWVEHKKIKLSDFVIRNDETESLIEQVIKIHRELTLNT